MPLKGEYNLSGSDAWPTFVAILERDGFYSLRLTPKLLDDLQTAVFALPWESVPTASPARKRRS